MNLSPLQIEQIVGEVVRRLRALQPAPVPTNANELVLSDAVVSVGLLDGKLTNVRKLVVRPKAVVTPAVRDELKKYGVVLERRAAAAVVATVKLLLAATNEAAAKELKLAAVCGERIESQATSSLGGTLREVARHVVSRKLPALILAAEPFAAVIEANRLEGVRAVMIERTEQIQQAQAEAKANLFVIPAGKLNPVQLRRIAEAIAAVREN